MPGPTLNARLQPIRGPLLMLLATLAFTIMVSMVKIAREQLSALEVICFRGVTSVPLAWWFARRSGLSVGPRGLLVLRIGAGFLAMFCFFTATRGLGVTDLAIIHKLQPILIAVFAPILLGAAERFGKGLWGALLLGLLGCTLVVGPELAVGSVYGLIALAGTLCSAIAHLAVRSLGQRTNPDAIVFWFQLSAFFLAAILLLATQGGIALPPLELLPLLLGIGIVATIGQVLMTRAYSVERATVVAAASYAAPIWGVLGDVVVFSIWPSTAALIGGGLIIVAGLILVRESPQAVVVESVGEVEHPTDELKS